MTERLMEKWNNIKTIMIKHNYMFDIMYINIIFWYILIYIKYILNII